MSLRKLKIILEMIKFEHSLFALPFAFMGAVLGNIVIEKAWPTWMEIFWVTVAMVGARSAAMSLNRVIDRLIDAKNPRTANRAIPAGLISIVEVTLFIVVSFAVLFIAAFQLNDLAVKLLPLAVFVLVLYSYTKRFTWLCHFVLGVAIGFGPLGGWVATTGQVDGIGLLLFASVLFWTAGFDIIYACQDSEFDRKEGLFSMPSRFGVANALMVARICHVITFVGLMSLYVVADLSIWFLIGVLISGAILIYEHSLVKPTDLSKLDVAFFNMNGILSVVMFAFTMIDLVIS
ncbi:UbiA-like polyprenyltransferase [Brevibacillus centrosporus]|jgi:4-hydroxybenzoate polyprenyltransferase|uniref:4-hydroxybenzoate polyprenyltransferase n=1 Tax=Brevibacillus centrosporus TaxID=54910 RepID=A0A1I3YWS1_9BACL|nr:UbiA-like polyprenyltransferase [Brevibacillus centrosporus]MEC2127741.1 UbiA-like polyprenyltransferase [Brevibacillus centrosporus]MED4910228.1 UbiA-like polyprenyltransferase [Brevibacillus centrosporus]RNB66876.1 4-hydroxybenzoate octaprenyltransferase [Brevibacillus centrosporus]SFK36275.1 4-hydroxybenzoate polyprenyltransferase [Brevibacillus centrosporus]GED30854.1 4-hydroxybenzoate octaprenyltransferase [Brevibacillus centrosporus]